MKAIWLSVAMLSLSGCNEDIYVCGESHPAVARARSLSQEQLAFLYAEIFQMRKKNAGRRVEYYSNQIPKSLAFLKAIRIRPSAQRPNIMLAGCMDEYIYLNFSGPDEKSPGIVLSWAAGTTQNPYNTASEMLWSMKR